MVNKKNKTKGSEGMKSGVRNTAKKVVKSQTAKKVKEVGRDVSKALDKIVDEGEKNIEKTMITIKKKITVPELIVEYYGNKMSDKDIKEKAYEFIQEKMDIKDVNSVKLYYKVEENIVYCVINETETIQMKL